MTKDKMILEIIAAIDTRFFVFYLNSKTGIAKKSLDINEENDLKWERIELFISSFEETCLNDRKIKGLSKTRIASIYDGLLQLSK